MIKYKGKIKTQQAKSMKTNTDASWLKSSNFQPVPFYLGKINTTRKKKSNHSQKHKTQLKVQPYQDLSLLRGKLQKKHSQFCSEKFNLSSPKANPSEKLRVENIELLQRNQQLIYEKQYLKQKLTLRDVQCRQLQRKLDEAHALLLQSQRQQQKKHKKSKTINSVVKTEKSSLLLSGFEENEGVLCENQNKHNQMDNVSLSWAQQTENDFNYLLESVDKQNNEGRKKTLRKMLANKAMEMKRIKAKHIF